MTDPDELSTFQRQILAVLADGPRKGLAVKDELQAQGYDKVNHGRLYPNLDRLVDAGYVDKSPRDERTNEYALTDEGLGRLTSLLRLEAQYLSPQAFRKRVMTAGQARARDKAADGVLEVDAGP